MRLGHRVFGPEQLVVMAVVSAGSVTAAMERVHAMVAEGADIVEISGGGQETVPFVAAVREAYPELVIGVRAGRPEVFREARAAGADLVSGSGSWLAEVAAAGAGVVVPLVQARLAVEMGVAAERIVVAARSGTEVAGLVATGWPVLVPLAEGDLATAAVAGWLGARVFRVDRVLPTWRALRMVAAIRGDIPPARAVRGLALSPVFSAAKL